MTVSTGICLMACLVLLGLDMTTENKTPWIVGLSNEDYHDPKNGASTSTLKNFIIEPAQVIWSQEAPQDTDKMPAIDFGTDFHAYFLEPEVFKEQYKVLPPCNRRVKAEKEAELELIKKWEKAGITAVTDEDMAKLEHMRQSAMAHPTVKALMGMNGIAEASFFWTDPDTGLELKCRPDWFIPEAENAFPWMPHSAKSIVVDIKTIAQVDKIQSQIENLKYFVQDAFYNRGVKHLTGKDTCFLFVFVSTSLSIGRYPVHPVMLTESARYDGELEVDKALSGYAQMLEDEDQSIWQTVQIMDRPHWATKEYSEIENYGELLA